MKQKIFNILVNFRRGRITVDNAIDQLLRLIRINHRLSASEMAEWFHDNYEEIAKTEGWQTQDECKVEFKDLPESNRTTMIKVCDRWLNGYSDTDVRNIALEMTNEAIKGLRGEQRWDMQRRLGRIKDKWKLRMYNI